MASQGPGIVSKQSTEFCFSYAGNDGKGMNGSFDGACVSIQGLFSSLR